MIFLPCQLLKTTWIFHFSPRVLVVTDYKHLRVLALLKHSSKIYPHSIYSHTAILALSLPSGAARGVVEREAIGKF